FHAAAGGLYYARVSGNLPSDYSLVVTRDATFETESNDTFATAQNISGTQGVLGAVTSSSTKLFTTGNDGTSLITINPATGRGTVIGSPGVLPAAGGGG